MLRCYHVAMEQSIETGKLDSTKSLSFGCNAGVSSTNPSCHISQVLNDSFALRIFIYASWVPTIEVDWNLLRITLHSMSIS